MDIAKAVSESKAGKIEYRTDRHAIVHLPIGKLSFDATGAARELRRADRRDRAREAGGAKGRYLHTVTITTSMNPGVRVDPSRTRGIVEEITEEPAEVA
jgi:large subunit ribosomal protein L1